MLRYYSLKKAAYRTFIYTAVILVVLYTVGPIFIMVSSSFQRTQDFFDMPPKLIPAHFTVDNYVLLFRNTLFGRWFLNSGIIAVFVISITIVISVLAAYSLDRFPYRGKRLFIVFSLFAYLLPPILMVIPLYLGAIKLGLANSETGLIIAYLSLCLPYSIWMLRSFLRTVPIEIEEAAYVDGASVVRTLVSIVVPMTLPGIISTAIFAFTYTWNEFLFALVFINSDGKMTFPVGMNGMITTHDIFWEYILTGSVLVSIPALIIFLFSQRALIKGFSAGAVKG